MQAQTDPQTRPCLSSSRFTCAGSMWDGSSTGISMVSKPHFLKRGKSFVLSLVKGEVKRKVLIPNRITGAEANEMGQPVKGFCWTGSGTKSSRDGRREKGERRR